jgi:bis(5'-nucleosyl)-tetraphosphatase (symmetrical)
MARYAIGDIQGCMASLERLLALIDFSPSRDQLWLVGDLVNRGPRSLDVLRWAYSTSGAVTTVLGNHDLHLLARVAGAADEKKRDTLDDVLNARDRDRLIDWLRERPLVHHDDRFVLVHAGLHPSWTVPQARALGAEIETQLRAPTWRSFLTHSIGKPPRWRPDLGGGDRWRAILGYLVRARMLQADGRLDDGYNGPPAGAPKDEVPWFDYPRRAWTTHTAVFGHWAALGLSLGPHHIALDTGCVWGKQLTAIRLDDRSVFNVRSVESRAPSEPPAR